jgi:DUF1365 family protein
VTTAPALYRVQVTHGRTEGVKHAFRYRHAMWLIDVDEVPELPRGLRWLARFRAADHLGDPDATLRENVDRYLAVHDIDLDGGRVALLTNARSLGYVFNPVSVFWCHDHSGAVRAVIAEVHNTHGERHCYLLEPDAQGRAEADKAFSVSPFFGVDGAYEITCPEPAGHLDLRIVLRRHDQVVFGARVHGTRETSRPVLAQALRWPLASYRVTALIRFEGLRLWSRRLPIVARPLHASQEGVQ